MLFRASALATVQQFSSIARPTRSGNPSPSCSARVSRSPSSLLCNHIDYRCSVDPLKTVRTYVCALFENEGYFSSPGPFLVLIRGRAVLACCAAVFCSIGTTRCHHPEGFTKGKRRRRVCTCLNPKCWQAASDTSINRSKKGGFSFCLCMYTPSHSVVCTQSPFCGGRVKPIIISLTGTEARAHPASSSPHRRRYCVP